jgi:hypothetical protein
MINPLEEWTIEPPIDFKVGETYIARAMHDKGYWADFLITITEKTENGDYGFTLDTILDGSPGILEGYTQRE